MKLALAMILAAASASLGGPPPLEKSLASKPLLLAKGQDYLVHGIVYPLHDDQARFRTPQWAGCVILYTKPSTGEMKSLVSTGTVEIPTERVSYHQSRILGVACDAERLYIVTWFSGRIWDHPPHPGQRLTNGGYSLQVFWLADGAPTYSANLVSLTPMPIREPVVAVSLPETAPQEAIEKGPLKLIEKGVACYGAAFEFEGKTLKAQDAMNEAALVGSEDVGKEIAYTGIAGNGKLGAYVSARDRKPTTVWLNDRQKWGPALLGKAVTVTGVLRMRMIGTDDGKTQALRQPVFYMTEYTLKVEGEPAPKP